MGLIQDLTKRIHYTFTGVDWAPLVAKYGSLEAAVKSGAYVPQMQSVQMAVTQDILSMGVNPFLTPDDYESAFVTLQEVILARTLSIENALGIGEDRLNNPLNIAPQKFRNFITGIIASLQQGQMLHDMFALQNTGVAPLEIARHADGVVRGYKAMKWLCDNGMVESLKNTTWAQGTKGMGGAPAAAAAAVAAPVLSTGAIWAIVIGSVAAICIIAYFITFAMDNKTKTEAVKDACTHALAVGNPSAGQICSAVNRPNTALEAPLRAVSGVIEQAGTTAIVLGSIYLGVMFLPMALENIAAAWSKRKAFQS
jgi:hypothetical protein